jgi:hypothetical protein
MCRFYFFFKLYSNLHHVWIVLNPDEKMNYFKKNWDIELQNEILESVEKIVSFH